MKLSEDDRRAIDMLLDQGLSPEASGSGRGGFAAPAVDELRARLRNAGELLGMLGHMPSPEPSQDLVARTLRYVERHAAAPKTETEEQAYPTGLDLLGLDGATA
jgi:hypothetical protein